MSDKTRRAAARRLYRALRRLMLPRVIYPAPDADIIAVLDAHVRAFRATPMRKRSGHV